MNTSPQIDKIVPALIAVKSKLQAVIKSANNPFFKSKYATLEAHLEAVEPLLAENGLVLTQPTGIHETSGQSIVSSILMHISGQYISSFMPLASKDPNDAQKLGSAITYGRRYTLGALFSMATESDDDGESAVGRGKGVATTLVKSDKNPVTVVGRGETATITVNSPAFNSTPIVVTTAPPPVSTANAAPKRSSFRKSVTVAVNNDDI